MRIQLLMTHGKNNESFKAKLHKQSVGKCQVGCKQLLIVCCCFQQGENFFYIVAEEL